MNERSEKDLIDELFQKTLDSTPKYALNSIQEILKNISGITENLDINIVLGYLEKLLNLSIKTKNIETEVALSVAIDELTNSNQYRLKLFKYLDLSEVEPYFSRIKNSNFNYNLILATIFKKQGAIRESLNYYEEALYYASKYNESKQELFIFTIIGRILNESELYENARSFYNLVFYNRNRKLNFTCQNTGGCCIDFDVNISVRDVLKIIKNKPGLKPKNVVNIYSETSASSFIKSKSDNTFDQLHSNFLSLKKKHKNKECIFLENNRCSINSFKPLTCKNWPMVINDDRITFSHNQYLKDVCGYCITPDKNNNEGLIKQSLREQNYNFNFQNLVTNKVNKFFSKKVRKDDEILNFVFLLTKKAEIFINAFKTLFITFPEIVKILISFNKLEIEDKIPIIIYCEGDPEPLYDDLMISLNKIPLQSVKKLQTQNINFLNIVVDLDFTFILVIRPLIELTEKADSDEFILFEKEDYNFPQVNINLSIPQDEEAYTQVLKAVRTVTKAELLRNNLIEAKEAFEKLIYLYNNTNIEESELIYLILDEIFYLHKFYFQSLNKTLNDDEYKMALINFEIKIINDFMSEEFFNDLIFEYGQNLVKAGLPKKANYYFRYLLDRIGDDELRNEYMVKIAEVKL